MMLRTAPTPPVPYYTIALCRSTLTCPQILVQAVAVYTAAPRQTQSDEEEKVPNQRTYAYARAEAHEPELWPATDSRPRRLSVVQCFAAAIFFPLHRAAGAHGDG